MQRLLELCADTSAPLRLVGGADSAGLAILMYDIIETCTTINARRLVDTTTNFQLRKVFKQKLVQFADGLLTALVTHYDVLTARDQLNLQTYSSNVGTDGFSQTMMVLVTRWNLLFVAYNLFDTKNEFVTWSIYTSVRYCVASEPTESHSNLSDLVADGYAAIRAPWHTWRLSDILRQLDVLASHVREFSAYLMTPAPTLLHSGHETVSARGHPLDSPIGQLLLAVETRAACFFLIAKSRELMDMRRDPFSAGETSYWCYPLIQDSDIVSTDDDSSTACYVLSSESLAHICHTTTELFRALYIHNHFELASDRAAYFPVSLPNATLMEIHIDDQVLCGAREWIELQAATVCDDTFRTELASTITHLNIFPGMRHRAGRKRARILSTDESAVQIDSKTTTQITWLRTLCDSGTYEELLSPVRRDFRSTMLLRCFDKCVTQLSTWVWRRNALVYESDFFGVVKSLYTMHTPVICIHGNCFSVLFNQRIIHAIDALHAVVIFVYIIVHKLHCKVTNAETFDVSFMQRWWQEWCDMGAIFLEHNPYQHRRYYGDHDLTQVPLWERDVASKWFREAWSVLANERSLKEQVGDLPAGFSVASTARMVLKRRILQHETGEVKKP